MAERGLNCATCGKQTLHRQREPNHILWAILTLFSCGVFGIVWIVDVVKSQNARWLCATCGSQFIPQPGHALPADRGATPAEMERLTGRVRRLILYAVALACIGIAAVLGLLLYAHSNQRAEARRSERIRTLARGADAAALGPELVEVLNARGYRCGAGGATERQEARSSGFHEWAVRCASDTFKITFDPDGRLVGIARVGP